MLQRGVDIRLSEAVPVRTRRITSLADGLQFQSRERVVAVMRKREKEEGREEEKRRNPQGIDFVGMVTTQAGETMREWTRKRRGKMLIYYGSWQHPFGWAGVRKGLWWPTDLPVFMAASYTPSFLALLLLQAEKCGGQSVVACPEHRGRKLRGSRPSRIRTSAM